MYKMKKRDMILILGILLAAGVSYLLLGKNVQGDRVVIILDGQEYGTYPLAQDRELDIRSEYGYNRIVIRQGKVSVAEADCPDKYCVKQGETSKESKSLICLPHKLVVEVRLSTEDQNDVDAVAQ